MFHNLIPKIFYDTLQEGLDFFHAGLGFHILHRDQTLAVVARDGAEAYVMQSPEYAARDRPELAVETDAIHAIYDEMAARVPHLLHPNARTIALKPWGPWEFAMRDSSSVCVIFRQWPGNEGTSNA